MTRQTSRTLTRVLTVTTLVGVSGYALTRPRHSNSRTADASPTTQPKTVTMVTIEDEASPAKSVQPNPALPKVPLVSLMDVKPTPRPAAKGDARVDSPPVTKAPQAPTKLSATVISGNPSSILPDGKTRIDAGDLVGGRKLLNDGLISGQLSGADAVAAKQLIGEANKFLVFSPRRFNDDPWAGTHQVTSGEVLQKIANKEGITSDLLLQINGMTDARKLRAGSTIKILHGPFHLVVTKKTFTLDVYLGSPGERDAMFVTHFPVGLGKDDGTPSGTWIISDRIRDPKWWGARGQAPIESGDPKNPLGKFWLALTGIDGKAEGQQSYGIHGTIEPDSIGKQASMGCIRMRNEDVAVVYSLVLSGKSTVVVKD